MAMIRRASMAEFGEAFGTHRFRHELASALAEADPDNPGVAAAVLGISIAVAEGTYIHRRDRKLAGR
jgi:integrase